MTHRVQIYGFGSAFNGSKNPQDFDLLIVHYGEDVDACRFAQACKRGLLSAFGSADITMLSQTEEAFFGFVKTARARLICTIHEDQFSEQIQEARNILIEEFHAIVQN